MRMPVFTSVFGVSSALRRVRVAAAAAALLGASAAAWAVPTTYTGQGFVGPVTPPSSSGSAAFVAQGNYLVAGVGSFDLVSSFMFNFVSGTGAGAFEFSQGGNSFSGSIATSQAPVAAGPGFEISYAITGGTGVYLGATGSGSGLIRLLSDPTSSPPYAFIEAGIMNVSVVPEPATGLLMLGGAAALFGRWWLKKA
jgi:hypothetical protein